MSNEFLKVRDQSEGGVIFSVGAYKKIIELCTNGDIIVKGKLIEHDKELVDGLREFLIEGYKSPSIEEIMNCLHEYWINNWNGQKLDKRVTPESWRGQATAIQKFILRNEK